MSETLRKEKKLLRARIYALKGVSDFTCGRLRRRIRRLEYMIDQMDPELRSSPVSKKAAARRWRKRKRRRKMKRESRRRNR